MRRRGQYLEEKYVSVRRVYPILIWRKCEHCGDEFRREYVWRCDWVYEGFGVVDHSTRYLCTNCASSLQVANALSVRDYLMQCRPYDSDLRYRAIKLLVDAGVCSLEEARSITEYSKPKPPPAPTRKAELTDVPTVPIPPPPARLLRNI